MNSPSTVRALVESLRYDPFYVAITEEFAGNEERRLTALTGYFDHSMSEGARTGRLVVSPDPAMGAAVWLLPASPHYSEVEGVAKTKLLAEAIGSRGVEKYSRIVDFMRPRASSVVDGSAWYLSIVGVSPAAQGRGIGARLLAPTLAEADRLGVECYLETFDGRNPRFYERLGFLAVGSHVEPVTAAAYTIMRRQSGTRTPRMS